MSQLKDAEKRVGVNQSWQNVVASRAMGVTYYNTTGRPITVTIYSYTSTSSNTLTVDGSSITAINKTNSGDGCNGTISAVVPNGSSYSFGGASGNILWWHELR